MRREKPIAMCYEQQAWFRSRYVELERRGVAFEAAGGDLLLLQCSPQLEELARFGETVSDARALPAHA